MNTSEALAEAPTIQITEAIGSLSLNNSEITKSEGNVEKKVDEQVVGSANAGEGSAGGEASAAGNEANSSEGEDKIPESVSFDIVFSKSAKCSEILDGFLYLGSYASTHLYHFLPLFLVY